MPASATSPDAAGAPWLDGGVRKLQQDVPGLPTGIGTVGSALAFTTALALRGHRHPRAPRRRGHGYDCGSRRDGGKYSQSPDHPGKEGKP